MSQHDVTILNCDVCGCQQVCNEAAEFYGVFITRSGVAHRQMELCHGCLHDMSEALRQRYGVCRSQALRISGDSKGWDELVLDKHSGSEST